MAKKVEQAFERLEWIDQAAIPVQKTLDKFFNKAPFLRDALGGKWLGHTLHPAVNDIPVGAWTSTLVLDIYGALRRGKKGRKLRAGADVSLAIGLVGAVSSAATGLVDYSKTEGIARRIGFVHAASNMAVAGLYGASFVARKAGLRTIGVALSTTGYGLMLGSAFLGGIMAYRLGVGVSADAEQLGKTPAAQPEHNGHKKEKPAHTQQTARERHHARS